MMLVIYLILWGSIAFMHQLKLILKSKTVVSCSSKDNRCIVCKAGTWCLIPNHTFSTHPVK